MINSPGGLQNLGLTSRDMSHFSQLPLFQPYGYKSYLYQFYSVVNQPWLNTVTEPRQATYEKELRELRERLRKRQTELEELQRMRSFTTPYKWI